jgi:N-acetylneuraminic acid mutarotase
MPTARGSLAVVALAGQLYALGGESTPGKVSDAVERYDAIAQTWSMLPAMPYRSHGLGAVVVGDAIYVMGGFTGAADAVGSESVALYRYKP